MNRINSLHTIQRKEKTRIREREREREKFLKKDN